MRFASYLLAGICWMFAAPAWAQQEALLPLLERMEAGYEAVRDYSAIFYRREKIDGEWRPEEKILLKFQKPFKVYMRWLAGSGEGREAIYIQGASGDKVLIHEAQGLARLFTFTMEPDAPQIMRESRYPFTEIGIGRLIQLVGREVRRAWPRKELRLADLGRARLDDRRIREIEGILPRDPRAGYSSYRMVLAIDEEHNLPIKALLYDWDNLLTGEYRYSELRLNPGLTDADFDPSNPAYNFSSWRFAL